MNIPALKAELLAGHPDTGAYNADNQLAADEINAVNRDVAAPIESMRNYFLLERKNSMFLMGRLEIVSKGTVGADPLGDTVTLTLEHISAAKTLLRILNPASDFTIDTNDSRFDSLLSDLSGGSGAKVIAPGDATAIKAFSTNQQSRAVELGLGFVRLGHIENARI